MNGKHIYVGRLAFLIIPLLVVVVLLILKENQDDKFHRFNSHLEEYTSVSASTPGEAYTSGKIIFINEDTGKVDDDDELYRALPDELRASKPEEVGTVVLLRCENKQVGLYDDVEHPAVQVPAKQWSCTITIVDMKTRVKVGVKEFLGDIPPPKIAADDNPSSRYNGYSGERPYKAIVDYIKSLPRGPQNTQSRSDQAPETERDRQRAEQAQHATDERMRQERQEQDRIRRFAQ